MASGSEGKSRDFQKGAASDLLNRLVHVRRVCKVVKGGKRFKFSSLVIVGDQKSRVGYGNGKAKEAQAAVKKAGDRAFVALEKIPLKDERTLYHDVFGSSGSCSVLLRSAKPGTGLIAGSAMRLVLEALGVKDVVGKIITSGSENNIVRATFDALSKTQSPRFLANKCRRSVPSDKGSVQEEESDDREEVSV